jgi:hypothetical protein
MKKFISVLGWIARGWSLLSLFILFLFIVGEGFSLSRIAPREWVGMCFFPIGVMAGFIIAWRRKIIGGSISIISLVIFYFYMLSLSGLFPKGFAFYVISAPGLLFLICGLLTRYYERKITAQSVA